MDMTPYRVISIFFITALMYINRYKTLGGQQ